MMVIKLWVYAPGINKVISMELSDEPNTIDWNAYVPKDLIFGLQDGKELVMIDPDDGGQFTLDNMTEEDFLNDFRECDGNWPHHIVKNMLYEIIDIYRAHEGPFSYDSEYYVLYENDPC